MALPPQQRIEGRLIRLQVKKPGKMVLPLIKTPVELEGVTITPQPREIDPIGCVASDRDLYRAEQDNVHLFIAFPAPPAELHLMIEYHGELFADRKVELTDSVGVEILAMLLPGSYSAYLSIAGRRIGAPVSFTVAEYTLAPLAGRLVSHKLKRDTEEFSFELAVESYQMPFDGKLIVALIEQGSPVVHATLDPLSAGRYAGSVEMHGEGPFRLRLTAADDPERVAEVAIPGSRRAERQATIISELGTEKLFSMMPEADALPLRGGYLNNGDFFATPLTVDEVVTDHRIIRVNTDVESLRLVSFDIIAGSYSEQNVGDVSAGSEVSVNVDASIKMVFIGCFVNGQPFEGYTTFIEPSHLHLSVKTPETIRPRKDLVVRLTCTGASKAFPVLLSVRDQRFTAAERPEVNLGTAVKGNIESATEGVSESGFTTIEDSEMLSLALDLMMDMELKENTNSESSVNKTVEEKPKTLTATDKVAEPSRTEFLEVLFYEIVPVNGVNDVIIPMGDSLCTFTVEAFTLAEGDWTQSQTTVVVDQPVRIDLELPPAVYAKDQVAGRLRAATTSGKACITLKHDGKIVELYPCDQSTPINTESVATPVELEFDAHQGSYIATVEDSTTGETDSIEVSVCEPGKFKFYARELSLLQKGESINLGTSGALTMRPLPAIDEPFDTLVTANAVYSHLCCEQTAAKILSTTFMYLTAGNQGQHSKAEQIILAGIAREKKMLLLGQGFAMYPENDYVSEYYSKLAVRYLWQLNQLDAIPDLSGNLRQAVREGIFLADQAAEAHQLKRVPEQIHCFEDAYAVATAGGDTKTAVMFINNLLDFTGTKVRLKKKIHAVAERAAFAYAAAGLIATGDMRRGMTLADHVTRQFNEQGTLYSTVDSVAAIALMIQLRRSGVITGEGHVSINGQEMTTLEASQFSGRIEDIEALIIGIKSIFKGVRSR